MCVCGPRRALHTPRVCSSSNPTAKRTHQVHCRGAFFRNGPFLTVQPWLSHLIAYLHSRGYPTSLHSRGTAVVIPPHCTFAQPWLSHLIAHLHSRGYPTSLHICTAVVIPPHCTAVAQPCLSHLIVQPRLSQHCFNFCDRLFVSMRPGSPFLSSLKGSMPGVLQRSLSRDFHDNGLSLFVRFKYPAPPLSPFFLAGSMLCARCSGVCYEETINGHSWFFRFKYPAPPLSPFFLAGSMLGARCSGVCYEETINGHSWFFRFKFPAPPPSFFLVGSMLSALQRGCLIMAAHRLF